jgi:4-hydroxy-tetrahydrodipicolinate reductase
MKVGVIGAAGRMGSTVCAAVLQADDMELVAAVDPAGSGLQVPGSAVPIQGDMSALVSAGADVAVDFTVAGAAVANALWCADAGIHSVIGTTGIGDDAIASIEAALEETKSLGCIVAPNFAIGAVLMMRFAELAAPWFESAEIIELHHDAKVDAPSGTALLTANRMASTSGEWGADPTKVELLPGARGGGGPGGIRIHSVRLKGLVAHQEILLGGSGQTLTIRHDSFDRVSFMPGVLLAVREVGRRPGVTVGLDKLLGIA